MASAATARKAIGNSSGLDLIVQVTRDLVPFLWPALEPLFAKVTKETHGCYEPDDVRDEILRGEQTLWVAYDPERNAIDAAMTTVLQAYPRRTSCRVLYVSGTRMKTWIGEFVKTIEQYARFHGATLLEGSFRRGWARVWPGAHEHGVSLYKDLTA
jgi:hypothetical protein